MSQVQVIFLLSKFIYVGYIDHESNDKPSTGAVAVAISIVVTLVIITTLATVIIIYLYYKYLHNESTNKVEDDNQGLPEHNQFILTDQEIINREHDPAYATTRLHMARETHTVEQDPAYSIPQMVREMVVIEHDPAYAVVTK